MNHRSFRKALYWGVLSLLFYPTALSAQKNDYFWVFSRNNVLDFIYDPPKRDSLPFNDKSECAASIADAVGNPRFYLNAVWMVGEPRKYKPVSSLCNAEGNVIENGDSIKTQPSMTQALLLPYPEREDTYIFFGFWDDHGKPTSLFYSIIDGKANGGKGKVIEKNILLADSIFDEKICAVKHGNGKDWWIATHAFYSQNYYLYLLNKDGIQKPIIQKVGRTLSSNKPALFVGQMSFAPTGDKLCASIVDTSEVFRFDRCTGLLNPHGRLPGSYGGAFSPDGQLFYHFRPDPQGSHIYQYDVSVPASFYQGSLIGTIQPEDSTALIASGQIQQGPDEKLYLLPEEASHLSVINKPNVKGQGCLFEEKKLSVKSTNRRYPNGRGLPNMPNYRLGAIRCPPDARPETVKSSYFEFYPNPAKENFTLRYLTNENFTLSICTTTGLEVMRYDLNQQGDRTIDISDLSEGMYIVKAQAKGGILFTEKLIVIR